MNTLPEDIKDTIYKYKHQIEFNNVINELTDFVCFAHACILLKLAYCFSITTWAREGCSAPLMVYRDRVFDFEL